MGGKGAAASPSSVRDAQVRWDEQAASELSGPQGSGYILIPEFIPRGTARALWAALSREDADMAPIFNDETVEAYTRAAPAPEDLVAFVRQTSRRMQYRYAGSAAPAGVDAAAWAELARRVRALELGMERVYGAAYHPAPGPTHLRSLPGCAAQLVHADSCPFELGAGADAPARLALAPARASLLVSLQRGTRLAVFPGSHRTVQYLTDAARSSREASDCVLPLGGRAARTEIDIAPGDALLFHQHLAHSGAAYAAQNDRLHYYMYPCVEGESFETLDMRDDIAYVSVDTAE